jgi:hypothetical protein
MSFTFVVPSHVRLTQSPLPPTQPSERHPQKGLLNTLCPLRAQSFARMLHAAQAAFPAHAIAGTWRPADIKVRAYLS